MGFIDFEDEIRCAVREARDSNETSDGWLWRVLEEVAAGLTNDHVKAGAGRHGDRWTLWLAPVHRPRLARVAISGTVVISTMGACLQAQYQTPFHGAVHPSDFAKVLKCVVTSSAFLGVLEEVIAAAELPVCAYLRVHRDMLSVSDAAVMVSADHQRAIACAEGPVDIDVFVVDKHGHARVPANTQHVVLDSAGIVVEVESVEQLDADGHLRIRGRRATTTKA